MHVQDLKAEIIQPPVAKARFQYSLENLRGLSILFVVLSHVTSFGALGKPGQYMSFLFGDATAWFVFISGYLFNYIEQRKFDYRVYLGKKAKFVILPYLILSVPAIAAGIFFDRHLIMGLTTQNYILWSLLVGGAVIVPMWFIPMISVFFAASPLFYRIGSSRAQYPIMAAAMAVSLFTSRPLNNLNPFLSFVHFAGFYLLGIVFSAGFSRISEGSKKIWANPVIACSLLLFLISSIAYVFFDCSESIDFMAGLGKFNNMQFGKLSLLIAIFFLFDRFFNVRNRFLGWMAEISFGLFFMQGFFMAVFMKFSQHVSIEAPWLMLALELTLLLGGSMVTVVVIKRILGKNSRYVIGC